MSDSYVPPQQEVKQDEEVKQEQTQQETTAYMSVVDVLKKAVKSRLTTCHLAQLLLRAHDSLRVLSEKIRLLCKNIVLKDLCAYERTDQIAELCEKFLNSKYTNMEAATKANAGPKTYANVVEQACAENNDENVSDCECKCCDCERGFACLHLRDGTLAKAIEELIRVLPDDCDEVFTPHTGEMPRFHPPIESLDVIGLPNGAYNGDKQYKLACDICYLAQELGINACGLGNYTVPELRVLAETIMSRLGLSMPKTDDDFVQGKKRKNGTAPRLAKLKQQLPKKFIKYQKSLRRFLGNLHTAFISSARAIGTQFGKVGLLPNVSQDELVRDLETSALVCLIASQACSPRAFTIETANRGSIDPMFTEFINDVLAKRRQTNWNMLALIHPSYVKDATASFQATMINQLTSMLIYSKIALETMWDQGVKDRVKHDMIVPRHGSGIDVGAWNAVADAWNNAIRYLRVLTKYNGLPFPLLFSVKRLVADDQMSVGNHYKEYYADQLKCGNTLSDGEQKIYDDLLLNEKKVNMDNVLLVEKGCLPWSALTGPMEKDLWAMMMDSEMLLVMIQQQAEELKIENTIREVCKTHEMDPGFLLGTISKVKPGEFIPHRNMICGVEVGPISDETIAILKMFGFAGAKSWTGK